LPHPCLFGEVKLSSVFPQEINIVPPQLSILRPELQAMKSISFRHLWYFAAVWLLSLLLHWPARKAGFISDFLGWQKHYRDDPFTDFLHSFGYHGHQQVLQFINAAIYRVFGVPDNAWYFIFSTLHALNTYLLYLFLLRIGRLWEIRHNNWIAAFGAAFFLLSPYHPEVTVWRVCLHYLISAACLLGAMLLTVEYLEGGRRRSLFTAHLLMAINLFTLELALVIPLLTHALCIAWWTIRPTKISLQSRPFPWAHLFRNMTLPQAGLYAAYFILNKLTLGGWVGHYGEERHLQIDSMGFVANPMKYLFKYPMFVRHWPHQLKASFFEALDQPGWLILLYTLLLAGTAVVIFFRERISQRIHLFVFLLWCGLVAALPVASLHFEWTLFNENDRYGYLTALFALPALAILLSFLPLLEKYIPAVLFVLFSAYLQFQTIGWWAEMETVYRKLLDEYQWQDKKEVFVLSLADNYRGIWMYRIYTPESSIADAMDLVKDRKLTGQTLHEVAFYNMNTLSDGITARREANGVIRVEFEQWGNWWWHAGLGARDYETDQYKVEFKGKWYELTLKGEHPDAVFIYQSGDSWKVL